MPLPALGPRATAAILLALTFAVGILTGVALDRAWLLPAGPHARWEREERVRERYRERLARELRLTPRQRAQIDSILREQQAQVRALRRRVAPEFRRIFQETRRKIEAVLTPEQRARLDVLRARWERERRDRARDRRRDPPPPQRP